MNIPRILALADVIEEQPHTDKSAESGFTMTCFEHSCGTPACLCGWTNFLFGQKNVLDSKDAACKALGISWDKGNELFYMHNHPDFKEIDRVKLWSSVTPIHAAAVLRNLAETREVDWEVGR